MTEPDEREQRLPKWAREALERARRDRDEFRRRLEDLKPHPKTAVWGDTFSRFPRPLALHGERVRFALDPDGGEWLDVRLTDRGLEIMGDGQILVRPQVTNVVHIVRGGRG
jgi:hypothetical protein